MKLRPGVSLVGMTILPSHVAWASTDSLDDEAAADDEGVEDSSDAAHELDAAGAASTATVGPWGAGAGCDSGSGRMVGRGA